ncbi:aldo/keto reductase family oxidoreductase [Gracilibacillus halophilus YIM-C55.5]|uniref:Aldo/keto reductase family oxidoreductase n=1 Tax=Gracilibacillus halophilus YIM-C55.5 TaxID=1308866 RepID=N4WTR4_9BACI|nr:aldo/keto reductase [Gracilibacillus halophilus]ENH97750.1 aldo/keto reductase family oxidoreductase [Gracilibacillus halophilus YIM-C55.5]
MTLNLQSTTTLHNGVKMPWFGLGVFKVQEGEEVKNSVKWALEHGYKHIDTAAAYKNEQGVGEAIKESGIPREELFVTSKLWNGNQGYDETIAAFETTLQQLGMDYLDLYLIHWPVPEQNKYKESWKAMEKLYHDGKIRAIGVSNFKEHHLDDLLQEADVVPMVNQVEYHPHLTQKSLHDYCKKHQIQLEAWSPLKQGEILSEPVLKEIAERHGKSPAQVILRWDLQNEVVTIPKSVKQHRIHENADVFDFELSQQEVDQLNQLNKDERVGPDPDEMNIT